MIKVLLTILSLILGLPLIWIGILHFQDPAWFEPIVPDLIGYPTFWVYASGVFEIVLGIGLIIPKTREISGYGIKYCWGYSKFQFCKEFNDTVAANLENILEMI